MLVSIKLAHEDELLFKRFAKSHNMSVSEVLRQYIIERIEGNFDDTLYEQTLREKRQLLPSC